MIRIQALLLATLIGCVGGGDKAGSGDDTGDGTSGTTDADLDGYPAGEDCDDNDAAVHPGADELCNGADDDCDDDIDEDAVDPTSWYADADGDGVGVGEATLACDAPEGMAAEDGDCDDEDAYRYPGADEVCDGLDNDCDEALGADEVDADSDGWVACDLAEWGWLGEGAPTGGGDCDDTLTKVHPDAEEVCDALDDDCDGVVPAEETDDDGDGYIECAHNDCDDTNADVHPGAVEACDDAADQDCDGLTDCEDPDCVDFADCVETCEDGVDNDGDGLVDCEDADCLSDVSCVEDCTDGVDNDADGLVDCQDVDDCTDLASCPPDTRVHLSNGRGYGAFGKWSGSMGFYISGEKISGSVATRSSPAASWVTCGFKVAKAYAYTFHMVSTTYVDGPVTRTKGSVDAGCGLSSTAAFLPPAVRFYSGSDRWRLTFDTVYNAGSQNPAWYQINGYTYRYSSPGYSLFYASGKFFSQDIYLRAGP